MGRIRWRGNKGAAQRTIRHQELLEIGLIATDEASHDIVLQVLPALEAALRDSFPAFKWKFEHLRVNSEHRGPGSTIRLLEFAHETLIRRGWDYAFLVTSSELDLGRRFNASKLTSKNFSSALVPIRFMSTQGLLSVGVLEGRLSSSEELALLQNLFIHLFGMLNGLDELEESGTVMDSISHADEMYRGLSYSEGQRERVLQTLKMTAGPGMESILPEVSRALFYIRVLIAHPWRILRMAMANRPWRLITQLNKLVFPALVTVPIALLAEELWHLGSNQSIRRLAILGVGIIFVVTAYIVVRQQLLRRMPRATKSMQVAMFNISSVLSILIAVTLVLVIIFLCTLVITGVVFPRRIIKAWLDVQTFTVGDYMKVSFLIACLASVVGWLGAGLEESEQFRYMLYAGGRRE